MILKQNKATVISVILALAVAVVFTFGASNVNAASKGSKIAKKATSYAYENENEIPYADAQKPSESKKYKDSQNLLNYEKDHNKYIKGDKIYASSDRLVCTAVRASGVDKKFPAGAIPKQLSYVKKTTKKWKLVKKNISEKKAAKLVKAGDIVFFGNSHVIVCTKNSKGKCKFVGASYCSYFPRTINGFWGDKRKITIYRAK